MSSFAEKKALKVKHAAAVKKHGAKSQAAGRIQYKLNNLTSNSKGNAVKSSSGAAIKTGTGGTVRSKPNPNKTTGKRIISKGIAKPSKTGGHPSAKKVVAKKVVAKKVAAKKKGPDFYKEAVALDKKKPTNRVKVTPLGQARGNATNTITGGPIVRKRNEKATLTKGGPVVRKRNEAAGNTSSVKDNPKLHSYVKLSDAQLELKAKGGDKRAISILKSRRYKG